jgi:UBX domain-containing protein 1
MAASNSFFQDRDEEGQDAAQQQAQPTVPDTYTGPRTLDGRPAPQAASSRTSRKPPQQKKKGVATLGSLGSGSGHQHDDDDDDLDDDYDEDEDEDDGRRNLFAGGEKSGLAVQDPKQQDSGPRKLINDILAKAKA